MHSGHRGYSFLFGFMMATAILIHIGISPLYAQINSRSDRPSSDFPGLDIQYSFGWDGRVDVSFPVPIAVLLSNHSESVLEGRLVLKRSGGEEEINLGDIFIGPNSVRRFSTVQDLSEWDDGILIFTDGRQTFWRRTVPLLTGQDFSQNSAYLLVFDDTGRSLPIPSADTTQDQPDATKEDVSATAPGNTPSLNDDAETSPETVPSVSQQEFVPADSKVKSGHFQPVPGAGREVVPVQVKTWQVPHHPGPLMVAPAIVISESVTVEQLNDAQWNAIGRWVSMGGTIFLSDHSGALMDRLRRITPLPVLPLDSSSEFATYRSGIGSIQVYPGSLVADTERLTNIRNILLTTSRLSGNPLLFDYSDNFGFHSRGGNADRTRLWVVLVLAGYTCGSGLTILMFRASRRQVAIYLCSIVLLASIVSAVVGGVLKNSRGDLHWKSVTQLCDGGMVQLAMIEVQSAGGRSSHVAVSGPQPDLQLLAPASRPSVRGRFWTVSSFSMMNKTAGFPPFSEQKNLLDDRDTVYQIRVPTTPWGSRQTLATGFRPEDAGVKLQMRATVSPEWLSNTHFRASGTIPLFDDLVVTGENQLPLHLINCKLVLRFRVVQSEAAPPQPFSVSNGPWMTPATGFISLGDVPPLRTVSRAESVVLADVNLSDSRYAVSEEFGFLPLPAALDGMSVWLTGTLSSSPVLSIDDSHGDFDTMTESHLFQQLIPAGELPEEFRRLSDAIAARNRRVINEISAEVRP